MGKRYVPLEVGVPLQVPFVAKESPGGLDPPVRDHT
jgi:hypothetical protein